MFCSQRASQTRFSRDCKNVILEEEASHDRTCAEVGLVRTSPYSLCAGSAQQVVHELQVREEVERERQEVRQVKREIKVEGESLTS